jgi:hypothetical protein
MKKLIIFGVIAIFLVASVGIVIASGNAAPKVTGDVWFTIDDDEVPRHVWFDAHEEKDGRLAKGEFHQEDGFGNYYHGHVTFVHVHNSYTDFKVYVDVSNAVSAGTIFYIRVYDGGEPGIGVDWLDGGLDPDYETYDNSANPIYEGNIQVHTYE